MLLGDLLHALELPSEDCRRADISRLAGFDDVVQRFHDLRHRRLRIESMNLIHVDVIHLQTLKAVIDLRHDVFARQAAAVRTPGAHLEVDFRCDDDFIAIETELADQFAGDLFARAHLIDVGGVEVIDAELDRAFEERLGVVVILRPRKNAVLFTGLAEAHHSEADARNIHARVAEFYILHQNLSFSFSTNWRRRLPTARRPHHELPILFRRSSSGRLF